MTPFTVFIVVLLFTFAIVVFLIEPSQTDKRIHERLANLEIRGESDPMLEDDVIKRVTFSNIGWIDEYVRHNDLAIRLQRRLEQAKVEWTVGRFMFGTLLAAGVGMLVGSYYITTGPQGWIPGIALGCLPYVYISQRRAKRFRKFNALLPESIDLMSRALRAGHSLQSTIEMIGMESEDPLGPEFKQASDEQSFGLPFREAMINLARRVPVPDLQFLITAMLVQKETGGNLAEVLDKTADVLRSRIRLQGQVRTHTAQGRLTGWMLCAMPFIVYFGMSVINRGYTQVLFEDPLGQRMVTVALVMMVIGILVIRKIVDVKV